MQKIFSVFLLFVYLTVSMGFTVNIHFCKGQIEKISIGSNDEANHEDPCNHHLSDCCHINSGHCSIPTDCCSDEYRFVKLEKVQIIPASLNLLHTPVVYLPYESSQPEVSEQLNSDFRLVENTLFAFKSPPYLAYHQLIFYA